MSPPSPSSSAVALPLLGKGFRPFFLASASAGAVAMAAWLLALSGHYQQAGAFVGVSWHAHEMLFGFGLALVAGFLLTAVPNWTGLPAITGGKLLVLVTLWFLGRLSIALDAFLPPTLVTLVDASFPVTLAISVGIPIVQARSKRNYGVVLLLTTLATACVISHGVALGQIVLPRPNLILRVGVDLLVLLIVIVGGRVVPLFTRGALKRAAEGSPPVLRDRDARDTVAVIAATLAIGVDLINLPHVVTGSVFALIALSQLWRMAGWQSIKTLRDPMLWILHVGYSWVVLGYLAKSAAAFWPGSVTQSAATHALAAGCISTFAVGMMARVSLGHTGRAILAPKLVTAAFVLVVVAGLLRVGAALGASSVLLWSAGAWSAGFLLLALAIGPLLLTARPDGKAG